MNSKQASDNVRIAVDTEYDQIKEQCFGLWSNCLWRQYDDLDQFEELKEAFFYLLFRLLEEGEIRLIKPDEDVLYVADQSPPEKSIHDVETHWIASSDELISYLHRKWRSSARDFDDADLNIFFYEIPPIVWKDGVGAWVGS